MADMIMLRYPGAANIFSSEGKGKSDIIKERENICFSMRFHNYCSMFFHTLTQNGLKLESSNLVNLLTSTTPKKTRNWSRNGSVLQCNTVKTPERQDQAMSQHSKQLHYSNSQLQYMYSYCYWDCGSNATNCNHVSNLDQSVQEFLTYPKLPFPIDLLCRPYSSVCTVVRQFFRLFDQNSTW